MQKARSGALGGALSKWRLAVGAATLALATVAAPIATAQEVADVIVVAQKRSENLQDVPIAVSAISAERLQAIFAGGGDVLQLAGRTPGLNVESSNGRVAPRFYIRGLGNTDFDLAASQPVSVIMDDIVMENVALKSFPLFDVNQVEVLRGPQGTLYGRNTPAGIVNIRTARPTDSFEAHTNFSWGSYNTASFDGAVSGPLSPTLSARASLLVQHRDDWVDNGFTGQSDALGGYDEIAGRVQVLWEATPQFSALVNLHGRHNEGTSTLFRANVFNPGSNELNGNFDRDRVFYDAGSNNPQEYDSYGASLTLDYDFGGVTLVSITGYETADGRSLGDIDGGNPGGPGVIPFQSETQDSLDDLEQWTQEIRLASAGDGPFQWQVGAYYFDSDLQITTVGPGGFPPSTTVAHQNESWAVFGQGSYDVTDRLTLTAGVRYTEDEKDFQALSAPIPVAPVSISDEHVSWDLTALYEITPDVNLYGRIASGFRAPTIQGRDVAFFNPPSTATSEEILSIEAGVKADVLDGTGRINAAVYHYTIDDQQFSAIGGAGNFNQLINAAEGEGYGFEIEAEFAVTERLFVAAGVSYNHTEIKDPNLAIAVCAQCTVLDPTDGLGNALVDGNPFPQAPEFTADLLVRYVRPWGDGGEFFAETDWVVRGETNIFLYDSAEFKTDVQAEGGLRVGYGRADGAWEAALFVRNITDEENVIGAIDFNNLTGFVNEPRVVGVSLSARF